MALGDIEVKITADTEPFSRQLKNVKEQLDKDLSVKVVKGLSAAFAGLTAAVGAAGIAGIKLAADMEQSEIAFTTMLGSAEKAKKFLADLNTFAAKTPFELPGLIRSSQSLMAFGFTAEQIIPTMTAVGDAVAGLGGGEQEIQSVVRALGKIQASGKVTAEAMMMMTDIGINGWGMIANALGVDIPTAQKMAEKGQIRAAEGIQALLGGMTKQFGGMMDAQSKSIWGMFSTLKDVGSSILRTFGTQLVDAFDLKTKMSGLLDTLTRFAQLAGEQGVGGALKKMIPPGVQIAIVTLGGALIGAAVPGLIALTTAAWAAVPALWATVAPLLPWIAVGAAVAAAAYLIYMNWDKIVAWFQSWVPGVIQSVLNAVSGTINWFQGVIAAATNAILTVVNAIITWFTTNFPAAINAAASVWSALKETLIVVWNQVYTAFSTVFNALVALWQLIWQSIVATFTAIYTVISTVLAAVFACWTAHRDQITAVWEAMKNIVMIIVNAIVAFWQASHDAIMAVAMAVWNQIKAVITVIVQIIAGIIKVVLALIRGDWSAAWEAIKSIGIAVWTFIQTSLQNFLTIISSMWQIAWNAITVVFQAAWDIMVQLLIAAWNIISLTISTALATLQALWELTWNAVKAFFITIWDAVAAYFVNTWNNIVSAVTTATTTISSVITSVLNTIQTAWEKIWNAMANTLSNIWQGIVSGIKGYINAIIGVVNGMISGLNRISFSVPDWVPLIGGKSWGFNLAHIPQLAEGGIVTRPTLALIGEAGPEAVVPLKSANNEGQPVHVHVHIGSNEVGDEIIGYLFGGFKQTQRSRYAYSR